MKDIIIGQIMRNKKIMGTGFLAAPDIFMTVKHNVIVAEDLVEEVLEEKEVIVQMKGNDCAEGVTINLLVQRPANNWSYHAGYFSECARQKT